MVSVIDLKSELDKVRSLSVTRFRDTAEKICGVPVSQMAWKLYVDRARQQAEARESARRAVTTIDEWRRERQRYRKDYESVLGAAPQDKVEVVDKGIVETKNVIVRKFLFSSFENNWIPANLYLPRNIDQPLPAVISVSGHSKIGKVGAAARGVNLAANGYAALIFDLPGAGERSLDNREGCLYPASTQHNIFGAKLIMAGGSLARIFVQDTMAAVTVLQGMAEIDPERIGITGGSGGGWLSVHAAALDQRIKVVVPAAAVWARRFEIAPSDTEQAFFKMQRHGIDYPDLLSFLIFPRPVFIISNAKDLWGLDATKYAYSEAARIYTMMGRQDHLTMQVWDRGHAYQPDQFIQAVCWFNRFFKSDRDADVVATDEAADNIDFEALWVCERRHVHALGLPSASLAYWQELEGRSAGEQRPEQFINSLRMEVGLPDPVAWAEMDRFAYARGIGQRICYGPENNLLLPVEIFKPVGADEAVILIDETDRRGDLDWQIAVAGEGKIVFRPDLRGWGETAIDPTYADWEGWARNLYAGRSYRLHALAHITGSSLVLDRVRDLLALLSVVEELAGGLPITVHGRRGAAWIALLAGLLDRRIAKLILERGLYSFRAVMECELPVQSADSYLPNLLSWNLDVADLVRAFDRECRVLQPLDAHMEPVSS